MRRALSAVLLLLSALTAVPAVADEDDRIVPAHEEPRHVPKLVNRWVRVIDVEIPEGERTLYHAHSLDYPYLMISSVTLRNQTPGQEARDMPVTRGVVGYYRAATQGTYTHRFINLGPGTFRAIGIELLTPLSMGRPETASLPEQPGLATVLDNERARAYRIVLQPGQSLGPLALPGPGLLVGMTPGRLSYRLSDAAETRVDMSPAAFRFHEEPSVVTLTNAGDQPLELVEFQFK
jgi:hypothetical protein